MKSFEARVINHKIYLNIINYLIGPKFPDVKYQIGTIKGKSNDDSLRIYGGYGTCSLAIYFGYGIRIYANLYTMNYGGCDSECLYSNLKEINFESEQDVDEYVLTTSTFLKELLKHAALIRMCPEYYPSGGGGWTNCPPINFGIDEIMPEKLNAAPHRTYEDLLLYDYDYFDDKETIEFMIKAFKSKRFKRGRGDNR